MTKNVCYEVMMVGVCILQEIAQCFELDVDRPPVFWKDTASVELNIAITDSFMVNSNPILVKILVKIQLQNLRIPHQVRFANCLKLSEQIKRSLHCFSNNIQNHSHFRSTHKSRERLDICLVYQKLYPFYIHAHTYSSSLECQVQIIIVKHYTH